MPDLPDPAPPRPRRVLRTLLAYVGMVGLPLLGLLLILRAGRSITPPPHVGGEWTVAAAAGQGCALPPSLALSQSGVHLSVALRGPRPATLDGRLRADSVVAGAPEAPSRLLATIDRAAEPDRMTGTLLLPECPPLPFTATRAPKKVRQGGGH